MGLRQRVKQLEENNKKLQEQQASMLQQLNELKEAMAKKYISDTTTKDDEPVPFAKVMDEYLNGEDGDGK